MPAWEMKAIMLEVEREQKAKLSSLVGTDFDEENQTFSWDELEDICFWVNQAGTVKGSKADIYKFHCGRSGDDSKTACGKDICELVPLGPTVKDKQRVCKTCIDARREVAYFL